MRHSRIPILGAALVTAFVATGCSDTASVDGMGAVAVTLQQASVQPAPGAAEFDVLLSPGDAAVKVSKTQVDSLFIWATRIGFLPVDTTDGSCDDEGDETPCPWIWLDLSEDLRIDLMALPAENDSAVVIAAGDVPVGDYRKVRLLVADASIFFNEAISVGNHVFDADMEHPLDVPSGAQSGLKTDASFSVVADDLGEPTEVNVVFDPNLTFNNVAATGSGKIKITPVLKVR